ncbi:MAG: acyl-CoA desaturase [Burkholderiales bacterium]
MDTNSEVPRIKVVSARTNPDEGVVTWSPVKSLWLMSHALVAAIGGALTFSLQNILVFLVCTAATLCLGHSLGMHRRLIHNSYECPRWMEYFFVHLGVIVGMAGPFGMIKGHDLRDWAQRQRHCHPYLRNGGKFLDDGWQQLHCDLRLAYPPEYEFEPRIASDRIYVFMERTWMLQQLPLTIVLFAIGGAPWVIWGICARVAMSVTGHWLIGWFAHNRGTREWHVEGAAVQGHNVQFTSLITMGESWHNNHHAYPGSAKLGLLPGQCDPGWWVLCALKSLGLVWNVRLPQDMPARAELKALPACANTEPCALCRTFIT